MKKLYLHILFLISFGATTSAQTFTDPNFSYTIISDGWVQAVGAAFTKDGQKLFVWEKAGLLYVCNKSGNTYIKQTTPVINLSAEVLNWLDHGFLGFALDPNYLTNGLIYLLYAVDRRFLMNDNSIQPDAGFAATIGRLTRYKTIVSGSNLIADPASRTTLIGETKSTGIPILHESHGIGTLAFAADGTLIVSAGDAASFNGVDFGNNIQTYHTQALADGIIRPQENVGSFKSQMVNSLSGKLLRIDPATGNGIPSNPFYVAAEPRSPKSRVWALGFRNPFRFIIKPGTGSTNPAAGDIGEIYVGDVGWETWEDFSIVSRPGQNLGWPLYEGLALNSPYSTYAATVQNEDEPNPLAGGAGCSRPYFTFRELLKDPTADGNMTIYNPCNPAIAIGTGNRYVHKRPSLDFHHTANSSRVGIFSGNNPTTAEIGTPASGVTGTPFKGNCVVAGLWYTGNDFPEQYRNKFFLADWGGSWMKRISVDFTDVITRVDEFAPNFKFIVCMAENPVDGTVVIVNMDFPPVGVLDYGGNQPPVAKPVANVTYGPSPLTVNFTGNTSFDPSPGGSIASYSWNFGGGSPATSTAANPGNVVFTDATGNPKKFVVKLTVTDNGGATNTDSVIISVNNTPPVVNITSPVKNSTYKPGPDTTYTCTATVTDAQHSGSQLKYEWQSFLRHNTHEHAGAIDNNVSTTMSISRPGCNGDTYYWLFKLKVTDAAGLSTTDSSKLFPDCSTGQDNTPPVVSSVVPANGATGVSTSTSIVANLNEPIDPATVTNTTFQLKDPGNNVITATVNTSSNQLLLTPASALAGSTAFTATIKGGASGVKDLAGNALASDYSWSFTTAAPAATTTNIFQPTDGPDSRSNDAQGIALGVKFRSSQNGFITGVRYFKPTGTTGTHIGQLWNSTGTLLAQATFTSETASGWQQVLFTNPVAITAGVTYVASYHSPSGDFAAAANYFTQAVVNGPLRALANGEDGVNGLYKYSATPAFPNNGYQSSNYWADVVFSAGTGQDLTPPTVTSVLPLNGATNVSINTTVTANFSEAINPSTVTGTTFQLRNSGGTLINGTLTTSGSQVVLTPAAALAASTVYTVTITGGASGVKDPAGNALANNYSWSFTTANVDNTPPTISSVAPANGATGISTGTTVIANFSEAINPSTVTSATFQLRDAGNNLVSATLNTSSNQVTLTPSASLAASTLFTATITGGASGVKDLAGNALASNFSWSFTTSATTSTCPCTVFKTTDTPAAPLNNDGQGIVLGMKFRSTQNGVITGIRYYKGAGTTGTHIGSLWSNTGTLMAQATFTNETASGWQQVSFATPVSITAGVTYIASYFSPSGHYAASVPYFSQAVVNGPLRALANGEDGPNGLYRYSSTNLFPNGSFNASNYWVDVVFNTTASGTLPNITTHPSSQSVCAGTGVSFNSVASGSPAPTVQWQESTDGTTWTNISGATAGTYSVNATSALNNRQYRAVWTNSAGSVNSNAATLTVKAIPATPGVSVTNNCGNSVLTATGSGGSLLWSTGATTTSITVTTAGTYTVTQTVNGCTSAPGSGVAQPLSSSVPAPVVNVTNSCGNSVLTASGFTGSLLWSNGATTASITVTTAGTYTVTQTVNGCTSAPGSGVAQPLASSVPAPVVNVTDTCGKSVLTASAFTGSLLWSNGATTASITVTTAGTYTVTQTDNGCTSAPGSGTAAPKPIPVLSSSLTGSTSSGSLFNYTPASTTAGTTYTWSRAAVAGISNAPATGAGTISETLINTGTTPVNVTYVITLTAAGCGNTQNVVITVNPAQGVVCTVNGTITSSFNSSSIPAGSYIWFNSVLNPGSFSGISGTVTLTITNAMISFAANNQQYTLVVPDARIRFDAAVSSATTQFVNGSWETVVPKSYSNYVFMTGLSYQVPASLPGNISNVQWTANIGIDKTNVSLTWKWAAATYTSFAGHTGLNIKPLNGSTQNPYPNNDNAGTPENYTAFVTRGAKSTGGTNYTGNYSGTISATCTPISAQRSPGPLITATGKTPATELDGTSEDLAVDVMPNPSQGFFNVTVKSKNRAPVTLRVVDITGQLIESHEKIPSNSTLRLGEKWPGGSYYVEVRQNGVRKFRKLIKVN